MSGGTTLPILLISSRAEDGRTIGTHLRGHFDTLHLEAVFSIAQGLQWAGRQPWQFILLDLSALVTAHREGIEQVQRLAPQADLLLYTDDFPMSPLQAMRTGAVALLHRQSPRFLDDLSAIIETRQTSPIPQGTRPTLSAPMAPEDDRSADTIVYELSPSGYFTYVSEGIRSLLGYKAEELLGLHFLSVVAPDSKSSAAQRFNERRAGARATRHFDLRLMPKTRIGHIPDAITARLCARGLYAAQDIFVGTVGLIQTPSQPAQSPDDDLMPRQVHTLTLGGPIPQRATTNRASGPAMQAAALEPIWLSIEQFLGQLDRRPLQPALQDSPEVSALLAAHHAQAEPAEDMTARPILNAHVETTEPVRHEPVPNFPVSRAVPVTPEHLLSPSADEAQIWKAQPTIERRQSHRKDVRLASRVLQRDRQWTGCTVNIGEGGLAIDTPTLHEPLYSHTVSITLLSDILFMDIWGTASSQRHTGQTRLHVRFGALDEVQRSVLQSFLEILNSHPDCLRVQLTIAGAVSPTRKDSAPEAAATSALTTMGSVEQDRRVDYRVPTNKPVWLCWQSPHGVTMRVRATLRDLHLTGALIQVERRLPAGVTHCRLASAPGSHDGDTLNLSALTDAATILLTVVREQTTATRLSSSQRGGPPSQPAIYGMRIHHHDDVASRILSRWVDHAVLAHMGTSAHRAERTIQTDRLFTHTAQDVRIALYHDYVGSPDPMLVPIVVIAPDLGQTKEDALDLAYVLASQGLHVLRYDAPHHLGESDGHDEPSCLSHLQGSLQCVLAFIEEFWPGTPILLFGAGLSGRLCARLLQSDAFIIGLALLHTPLDLSDNLYHLRGHETDLLSPSASHGQITYFHGVRIQGDTFVDDAVAGRYVSPQDLLNDLRTTTVPIAVVAPAPHSHTTATTAATNHWRQLLQTQNIDATIIEAPAAAPAQETQPGQPSWMTALVQFCVAQLRHGPRPPVLAPLPERDRQDERQLERLRVRGRHLWTRAQRHHHWTTFTSLTDATVHQTLAQAVLPSLATQGRLRRILEVGCGQGALAAALATHQTRSEFPRALSRPLPLDYVGVDCAASTVEQARARWLAAQPERTSSTTAPPSGAYAVTPQWLQGEFDAPLPICDAPMDAVVITLVLGHYINPRELLHECWRLLAPGGQLILLSLHPTTDLLHWCRPAFDSETERDSAPSRSNAHDALRHEWTRGWAEGSLLRFTADSLTRLIDPLHPRTLRIEPALDGHAHLLTAQKP